MRLISKVHDYYDGALKAFYSDEPVYFREPGKVVLCTIGSGYIFRKGGTRSIYEHISAVLGREDGYRRVIVGFCGTVYYMMRKVHIDPVSRTVVYEGEWRAVGYDEFMKIHGSLNMLLFSTFTRMPNVTVMKEINEDLFITLKSPVYIIRYEDGELVAEKNPQLKPFGFASVVNPYTAVQELQMYIGNQLAHDAHPVMPVGSDEVIAASKGFDKYSFRKSKQIKRKQ